MINTCREMGVSTVTVYSDVDKEAVHVLESDQAVLLGNAEPAESYLNIDKIIAAAKETGAEAIHPEYGFLAEVTNSLNYNTKGALLWLTKIYYTGLKTRSPI